MQKRSVKEFVCKYVHPGLECGMVEFLVLGLLYYLTAVGCIYPFFKHIKSRKYYLPSGIDFNIWYWVTMIIYLLYHGTLGIFYIPWSSQMWYLCGRCIDAILMLIPLSFIVMIICEMYFTYRNPGYRKIALTRLLFIVFLIVFLFLGVITSIIDFREEVGQNGDTIFLWHACTNFLICIFLAVPSVMLIRAIQYPVIQPEDQTCVKYSNIGIVAFIFIFIVRFFHNILTYCNVGPVKWYAKQMHETTGTILNNELRAFEFLYQFFFDFLPALFSIITVYVLRQHDLKFVDDPFYGPEKSETTSTRY